MSERPETPLEQSTLELWTSNSWRRFHFREGGSACEPTVQPSDNHPDLYFPDGFDGPVARRFLATWNACKGIPTDTLEAVASGQSLTSISVYRKLANECAALERALSMLYDAVQRGDFDNSSVAQSPEANLARLALIMRGATFDQYFRRSGAVDKHGNVTP